MKIKAIMSELKEAAIQELQLKIEEWRKELVRLRMNTVTSHVKDSSQFNKLRKNIARALTVIAAKESLGKVS